MKITIFNYWVFILFFIFLTTTIKAQEQQKDTLASAVERLQTDLAFLKNLKISGYVQFQGVFGDSLQAGGMPKTTDKIFQVRRGRLKFAYSSNPLNLYVVQFDITEKGLAPKDVYVKFTDPFVNFFSVTGGLFNRNWGYEIEYSSSLRESPERARVITTLFPGERDLGAMLTIQAPKTSRYNFLKLDLGLFAGNGINPELDKYKDFIGRLNFTKSFLNESLKLGADISYYYGGFANFVNTSGANNGLSVNYKVEDINGVKQFVAKNDITPGSRAVRELYGADCQVSWQNSVGLTTLRGEYVWGKQPATASSSTSPTPTSSAPLTSDAYIRNVRGYYVYFVQGILQSRHSIVVKYDVYDPNTDVKGEEITAANGFTSADVKYSTLGLGYSFRIDSNIKFTAYYDMVTNESTGISGYTKDRKDNFLTLRLQYKF